MNPELRSLTPEQLACRADVYDYLRHGRDAARWNAAREADPTLDASLRAARMVLGDVAQAIELDGDVPPGELDTVWSAIAERTKPVAKIVSLPPRARRRRRYFTFAAIAASVALAVFLLWPSDTIYRTAAGETAEVALTDGSVVYLAPSSSIEVSDYGDQVRNIHLEGEAFFEVAKGSPFTVHTDGGTVSVLGTSFEVDATALSLDVRCATGKVSVSRGRDSVLLTPGRAVAGVPDGLAPTRQVSPFGIAAWRTGGDLDYRGVTVDQIAADLERFYNREVHVAPQLARRNLDVVLPSQDFAEAISRLSLLLDDAQIDTSHHRLHFK